MAESLIFFESEEILLFDIHNMAQIGLNTTERDVDLPCRADLRPTLAKNTGRHTEN